MMNLYLKIQELLKNKIFRIVAYINFAFTALILIANPYLLIVFFLLLVIVYFTIYFIVRHHYLRDDVTDIEADYIEKIQQIKNQANNKRSNN